MMSTIATSKIRDEEDKYLVVDSGLDDKPLTAMETISYIVGANIGAGVLSLAYASRKAGFIPLLVCLALTYIICTISMLYVAESCLRTKGSRQISGLTHRYLGKIGSWIVFLGVAGVCYGALTAYMAGSGDILHAFFGEKFGLSKTMGSLIFFIPAIGVMYIGFKALGIAQKVISLGMSGVIAMLIVATFFHQDTHLSYLLESNWEFVIPIFNVAVFILGAQFLVPEIVRGNKETAKEVPKLIITGMGLVLLIVIIIPASVIALVGLDNITQVATLSWGAKLGNWAFYAASSFALLAILTSYWGLGGALFSNMFDHLQLGSENNKLRRIICLALIGLPPFLLAYMGKAGFVNALYFSGTIGGIVMGILPPFLLRQSRKNGDRIPEFTCGIIAHPALQSIIILVFVLSGVYALAQVFGMLPASW